VYNLSTPFHFDEKSSSSNHTLDSYMQGDQRSMTYGILACRNCGCLSSPICTTDVRHIAYPSLPSFGQPMGDDVHDDRHGGNSKMISPLKTGGRYCTRWCFMLFRSIVDNSLRDRCMPASLEKYDIMLTWSCSFSCTGGWDKTDFERLLNGLSNRERRRGFPFNFVSTAYSCFGNVKSMDSPLDSLDNSIIGSSLSTLTARRTPLL